MVAVAPALDRQSSLFREPGVHGAILTEALASRFEVHIEVTTDWDLAKHLGVPAAAITAAVALNADLETGKVTWAPNADWWIMPTPRPHVRDWWMSGSQQPT